VCFLSMLLMNPQTHMVPMPAGTYPPEIIVLLPSTVSANAAATSVFCDRII
jgi:hypothetical protein